MWVRRGSTDLMAGKVVFLRGLLSPIRVVDLTTEDYDLPSAMEFLRNRKDFFKDLRLDTALNEMLWDAREFTDEIDIPANFELTQLRHRVRRSNVNFDYEAREDPIEDPTLKYKTEFYFFHIR
ncbi:uncharacterized protein TNCV_1032541 [Trichonephila clavipes]|nr:uncharacterized protein TNCV_1032541 [Trichonephila clavipes]